MRYSLTPKGPSIARLEHKTVLDTRPDPGSGRAPTLLSAAIPTSLMLADYTEMASEERRERPAAFHCRTHPEPNREAVLAATLHR
jgi:hypothetical protein